MQADYIKIRLMNASKLGTWINGFLLKPKHMCFVCVESFMVSPNRTCSTEVLLQKWLKAVTSPLLLSPVGLLEGWDELLFLALPSELGSLMIMVMAAPASGLGAESLLSNSQWTVCLCEESVRSWRLSAFSEPFPGFRSRLPSAPAACQVVMIIVTWGWWDDSAPLHQKHPFVPLDPIYSFQILSPPREGPRGWARGA